MDKIKQKKEEERQKEIKEKEIKKLMKEQGMKMNLYTQQKMHKSFDKEILKEIELLGVTSKLLEKYKEV